MRVEVLVIGDEVLDGRIVDTNSQRLAQALRELGVLVAQRTVITDDIEIIVREAELIAGRGTEVCVVSGGLGPTSDDLTAEAFAKFAGVPLVRDAEAEERIVRLLQARGREAGENQRSQADRPQGAQLIDNPVGTAPGFALQHKGCRFVSVPGVPREFDNLVERAVLAPLRATGRVPLPSRGLYLFGIAEGDADRAMRPVLTRFPEVRLQFRVRFPEVHVTLHAPPEHVAVLEQAHNFAREVLRDSVYAEEPIGFAEVVLNLLGQNKATVAVAESCTGGLMTDMLTDVPGSSDALHVGVTAYANGVKTDLLGVSPETLREHGAVSEAVVQQMAQGVRRLVKSDYGLAVSGIAGPGGGSANKPVGTIWCALAHAGGEEAKRVQLPHGRRDNKVVAAYVAFDMLRRHLLQPQ